MSTFNGQRWTNPIEKRNEIQSIEKKTPGPDTDSADPKQVCQH